MWEKLYWTKWNMEIWYSLWPVPCGSVQKGINIEVWRRNANVLWWTRGKWLSPCFWRVPLPWTNFTTLVSNFNLSIEVGSKAADVAQSGRCCLKRPMIGRKRTMFVRKQPMIDLKRPMCPKAADVFAKSGRCPLRTKAADVEIFYFEIFWAKAADVP